MGLQHDDSTPRAPAARPRGWLRAVIVGAMAILFVGAAVGFIAFLSQLRGVEIKPARNADGIVVLTGGSSRVSDAMELLAGGYGKRLLISGVHPTNAAERHFALAARQPVAAVALLRRSRPFGRQYQEQRRRDTALGPRARLQVADRGDVELPHAAGDRGAVACDP